MRWFVGLVLLGLLVGVGWAVAHRLGAMGDGGGQRAKQKMIPPVAVAPIQQGRIELRRVYSGTLEARARFVVAPKVGGRIEKLTVDLSDPVQRGQVIAELDDAEFIQAVEQAKADLAVAEANITEATNALTIAERELERVTQLKQRGVASESQLDTVKADELAKSAAVKVAKAQAQRARSSLESANIRLGYTRVAAAWSDSDNERIVAERFVDPGETVTANTPLMTIVDLTPITGVFFATEKDYARLEVGQSATLTTDAYPGREFAGTISRIAPVFREASRQARVELSIDNEDHLLKPGMFIRAGLTLDVVDDATIVPVDALVIRDQTDGVFVINDDGKTVSWRPVAVGIQQGERVQITGEKLSGKVVTLGQQLISDGSEVTIPEDGHTTPNEPEATPAPGSGGES
ncbi:efflux RND transporter periplasmic adaptor subunit [Planctomycetales bacterium ZRK34]|nr:efflux RND transporter periplasmic adaptor subunit [Planctomycetales bacterium ZRK34]